ncbi:MAG: two-component system sensor histidine kinase SenX3 [Minisyncoccia bacterium]|jgi:two-component system sensor histidine kinase SenX3
MAVLLAAITVTVVFAAAIAVRVTQQATRSALLQAMGGRPGNDPVDEHHRLLQDATRQTSEASARVDLLQLSLDALTSGVVVTDGDGQVLVKNRQAGAVTDRPHEQSLVEAALTELLASALQGDRVERELEVFGPPSRMLFVHAVPITADGQMIGALAVIEDVSEHHRIDKTRRDFVANLSHELRTPVGAVSLLGEMLVDEPDSAVRKQLTDRLLIEVDRMSVTIDDLLELSRIESTTQSYDEPIHMQTVVDEALERTRVAAEMAEIEVGSIGPNEPIMTSGNRDQLVTALVNLVENAIKYSSAGDSISVRSRADNDEITLVVQDSGRGIPARDLDRIFERFYRVDRARESTTGGTGIGLSIVRHVAINHGGTVVVTSFEGDGSTFTMTLPRSVPQNSPEPAIGESHQ